MYKHFVLVVLSFFLQLPAGYSSELLHSPYLVNRIPQNDQRYATMNLALNMLDERKPQSIIETGTARHGTDGFIGDGSATLIFGDWAEVNDKIMYSVDIDGNAIIQAKKALGKNNNVIFVCHDSVSFLRHFPQEIDFLYLDSFDFDFDDPLPSQKHQLKEIIAAYPKLKEDSVVMIDDCGLPHGGKGALSIPYLLERGWIMIANSYQVILVRENS